jgi:hypothetical protein
MVQIKNKFDKETKKKIVNSLWLSFVSVGLAFIASVSQGVGVKVSIFTGLATGGTFLLNTVREYIKGQVDV